MSNPVAPLCEQCRPIRADSTLQNVRWNSAGDLSPVAGKPVAFRFVLRRGRLVSFWVSPDSKGASGGYVAGGGPAYTGPTDTVGTSAH